MQPINEAHLNQEEGVVANSACNKAQLAYRMQRGRDARTRGTHRQRRLLRRPMRREGPGPGSSRA
jgi:hypothetical protein